MAIKGVKRQPLSAQAILNRISEYDIFKKYMPYNNWNLNEICSSPFRKDKNASFIIRNNENYLSYVDYGDTNFKGGCIEFVKQLYNINFREALEKIDFDFGLGILNENNKKDYTIEIKKYVQPVKTKNTTIIQVITKPFTIEELSYWNEFHQDISDLKKENIYSIDKVYLNKQLFVFPKDNLKFGYFYDGFWKIYQPYGDRKTKWVPNNVPITTMDGLENCRNVDTILINKSKKDYMVMKKLFPSSCAVQNEGVACFSEDNVKFLKDNSKKQILSFDSDVPGVKNSQQITKLFDFDYLNSPRRYLIEGTKDWADLAKTRGMQAIEKYLKQKQLIL